jgi:hypothetical protein
VRDHALARFKPTAPIRPDTDGWFIIEADLENPAEACAAVLAQAGAATVLAPPELATLVHQAATRIRDSHP